MHSQIKQNIHFFNEKFFKCKVKEIFTDFPIVQNLAGQKCLFALLIGVIKSRKVQLPEVAQAVHTGDDTRLLQSIIHRVEDFFREVIFDYHLLALFFLFCLGTKGKIRLCLDRTEWDFGQCQVTILRLTASCGWVQEPLFWELLDNKSGNSNTIQRIDLIQKAVDLIGVNRIGILIADREFIGHKWLKYLSCQTAFRTSTNKTYSTGNRRGRLGGDLKRLKDGDLLFLIGRVKHTLFLPQIYAKRWQIECFFQHLKGRGFDIESTPMKRLKKLNMWIGMVGIASVLCQAYGVYHHEKVHKIKTKKHGYKTKSFARVGLDKWRWVLKQTPAYFEEFSSKFMRYLQQQKCKYIQKYDPNNYSFSSS